MQQHTKPRLAYGIKKAEAARMRRELELANAPTRENAGIFASLRKAFS